MTWKRGNTIIEKDSQAHRLSDDSCFNRDSVSLRAGWCGHARLELGLRLSLLLFRRVLILVRLARRLLQAVSAILGTPLLGGCCCSCALTLTRHLKKVEGLIRSFGASITRNYTRIIILSRGNLLSGITSDTGSPFFFPLKYGNWRWASLNHRIRALLTFWWSPPQIRFSLWLLMRMHSCQCLTFFLLSMVNFFTIFVY